MYIILILFNINDLSLIRNRIHNRGFISQRECRDFIKLLEIKHNE
jgi:hypothetical protein